MNEELDHDHEQNNRDDQKEGQEPAKLFIVSCSEQHSGGASTRRVPCGRLTAVVCVLSLSRGKSRVM